MKFLFYSFTFALLFACSQPAKQPKPSILPTTDTNHTTSGNTTPIPIEGQYQPAGDSVVFPPFSI